MKTAAGAATNSGRPLVNGQRPVRPDFPLHSEKTVAIEGSATCPPTRTLPTDFFVMW
jgi:hypothetical protein